MAISTCKFTAPGTPLLLCTGCCRLTLELVKLLLDPPRRLEKGKLRLSGHDHGSLHLGASVPKKPKKKKISRKLEPQKLSRISYLILRFEMQRQMRWHVLSASEAKLSLH